MNYKICKNYILGLLYKNVFYQLLLLNHIQKICFKVAFLWNIDSGGGRELSRFQQSLFVFFANGDYKSVLTLFPFQALGYQLMAAQLTDPLAHLSLSYRYQLSLNGFENDVDLEAGIF